MTNTDNKVPQDKDTIAPANPNAQRAIWQPPRYEKYDARDTENGSVNSNADASTDSS